MGKLEGMEIRLGGVGYGWEWCLGRRLEGSVRHDWRCRKARRQMFPSHTEAFLVTVTGSMIAQQGWFEVFDVDRCTFLVFKL